jgi:uracil-DNA glycosylase family 4
MSNILEDIWANWKNNESLCSKCPNNDLNNYWYPLYAIGNFDSPVMVIGDTPAYNIEGMSFRDRKNAYSTYDITNDFNSIVSSHLQQRQKSSTNKLIGILNLIADSINLNVQDLYFTNAKKCGNIPQAKSQNKQATQNCAESYLEREIEYIDPELIISIGATPFQYLKQFYNIDASNSIIQNHGRVLYNKRKQFIFLILAHWGYFRRNNILDEYYKDIRTQISKIVKHGGRVIENSRICNA